MADRIARLSEGQRACLRLVRQAKKSEEIAFELGISVHTVNKRIEKAMKLVGAQRREIAAMMLERYEGGYEPLAYEPLPLPETESIASTTNARSGSGGDALSGLGRSVRLSWQQRILWTVITAFALLAVFGVGVAVANLFRDAVRAPNSQSR